MIRVFATREGRLGHVTASGYRVDAIVPFVALPSVRALHRFIRILNPLSNQATYAVVLDVGPWNTNDDAYVFAGQHPQAESGTDERGRQTNRAGIDLSERVWHALGMLDNGAVDWEFLS